MSPARRILRALVPIGVAVAVLLPAAAAHAVPSAAEIQERINKSSNELEKLVEKYNRLNEQLKQTKAAAEKHAAALAPLQTQMEASRAAVGQLATTAYKTPSLGALSALLENTDQDSLIGKLDALDHLARQRQQEMTGFQESRKAYDQRKQALDQTLRAQTAQIKTIADGRKKIEADLDKLYEMRRQAYGSATSAGKKHTGAVPKISGKAGVAVAFAYDAIGAPYVWAAAGPNGYDCSGLTLAAWRAANVSLPHNAAMQWDVVTQINRSQLQPGDLVFYSGLGHVALYVGNNQVIHAPTFGESVKLAPVDMMPPYGYGRV